MTPQQKEALSKLDNKTVKYEGKAYDIVGFKITFSNVIVFTKQRTFNFLISEIDNFLNSVEIIEDAPKASFTPKVSITETLPAEAKEKLSLSFYEPTAAQLKMQQSLEAMLDKVMSNPEAIPQAKTVIDIANAMVNMEKSQLQLMQFVRNNSKRR